MLRRGLTRRFSRVAVAAVLFLLTSHIVAGQSDPQRVRIDFSAPVAVEARPKWVRSPARHAFRQESGVGVFEVEGRHAAMKWVLPAKIDLGRHRWFRCRYRARQVATESTGYAVWLDTGPKGIVALHLYELIADGQWHVATTDVHFRGYGTAANQIAIGVAGNGKGHARLEVDWLEFGPHPTKGGSNRDSLWKETTFAATSLVALPPSEPAELSGRAVRVVDGAPRLFANGSAAPAVGWFGWWFAHRPPEKSLRNLRAAGLDMCFTDVRADNASEALARLKQIVSFNPKALVVLRTKLYPGDEWLDRHPEERALCSDGSPGRGVSFASARWRDEMGRTLSAFVSEIQGSDLAEHVLGYHLCAGISAEWMHWECQSKKAYDFSEPMVRAFRGWLRQRYGSVSRLRAAWHEGSVDFDSARIPTLRDRQTSTLGLFRDPLARQPVIDYYQCLSDVTVDTIRHFARIVRQEAPRTLIGVFYGYVLHSTGSYRAGHCSMARLLESPDVDFVASPINYYARPAAESPQALGDVALARGRLFFNEIDSRIYLKPPEPKGFERTLWIGPEKAAVLTRVRRSFYYSMSHGAGLWWMFVNRGERYADPDLAKLLAELQRIARKLEPVVHHAVSEVVVLVSDYPYFGVYDLPLSHLWSGLARSGVPYDVRLVSELPTLTDYKVYVFPNAWYLSPKERESIAEIIRGSGKVAVWMLAPGVVGEKGLSLGNVEAITGIRVRHDPTRFEGVIPHGGATEHEPWGVAEPHGGGMLEPIPTFFVEDEEIEVLFDHASNGRPAIARRSQDGWTSIYSAAPFFPADVWAVIFEDAGLHLYAKPGTVVYADSRVVCAYTEEPGEHVVRFPHQVRLLDPVSGDVTDPETRQTKFSATGPTTAAWLTEKP